MMNACYVFEQPLLADLSAGATRFFREQNGLLHHQHVESEIQHFHKISTIPNENGKLGGWLPGKLSESKRKPNALLTESKTKAKRKPTSTQEPRTINHEPALELRERAGSYPSVGEVRAQASLIAPVPQLRHQWPAMPTRPNQKHDKARLWPHLNATIPPTFLGASFV